MLSTCIYHRSQTFDMSAMGALATKAPVLAAFFVAATMASIGLPGFGNFWGEFTVFVALAESDMTRWLVAPAAIGIIISAIYGLRAVGKIFFGQPKAEFTERYNSGAIEDLKGHEKLPASILVAGLVLTGIFPRFFADDADRELAELYPKEESHLSVQANSAPSTAAIYEEVSR
jgi:NADH-quinone oxidoreductase subunit M